MDSAARTRARNPEIVDCTDATCAASALDTLPSAAFCAPEISPCSEPFMPRICAATFICAERSPESCLPTILRSRSTFFFTRSVSRLVSRSS